MVFSRVFWVLFCFLNFNLTSADNSVQLFLTLSWRKKLSKLRNVNKQTKFFDRFFIYLTFFSTWDVENIQVLCATTKIVFFQFYAFCVQEKIPASKRFDEFFCPFSRENVKIVRNTMWKNSVKTVGFAIIKLYFIFSIWDMANVQAPCAENMLPRKQSSLNLLHFVFKKKRWSRSLGGLLQCFGTFLSIPHTVVLQMFGLS